MAEKEMRVCTVSHEVPGDRPGRFKKFEAGVSYPAGEIDKKQSRPVKAQDKKTKKGGKE